MNNERRNHNRPESIKLLDYYLIDDQGRQENYSMARTLNVSAGGVLIETHQSLPKGQQIMVTIGLDEDLVDVTGTVIYSREESGRFHSGIKFFKVADKDQRILTKYIAMFDSLTEE